MTLAEAFKRRIFGDGLKIVEIDGEAHVPWDNLKIQLHGNVIAVYMCQGDSIVGQVTGLRANLVAGDTITIVNIAGTSKLTAS